jgi:hypothetical protein
MEQPTIKVFGFRTTYHQRKGQTEMVARDWVKYAPIHNIGTVTEEMVKLLQPPQNGFDNDDEGLKIGHMQALWSQIEPHYRAWKEGTEVPESGIPLSAWAGVTSEQADVLRKAGLRTVEDVAGMTEGQMAKVMLPGVRSMKLQANEFLSSRGDAETAAKVTALAEQNQALSAQLEEMHKLMSSLLSAKAQAPSDEDDADAASNDDDGELETATKRGRGRPRKVAA